MDLQIAFFNNANQIIYYYYPTNQNSNLYNFVKDTYFDQYNDSKIVMNYDHLMNVVDTYVIDTDNRFQVIKNQNY